MDRHQSGKMAKIRLKHPAKRIARLIRTICGTLSFRVVNHAGMAWPSTEQRTWIFWHNRMFLFPWLHQNLYPGLGGAVLTSASGDSRVTAEVCAECGFGPGRGSISRRRAMAPMALAECVRWGPDSGS